MNLLDINEKIQTLETSQDLLRWKLESWCVWPILRFTIASLASNLAIDSTNIRLSLSEHFRYSIHDITSLAGARHPKVLLYVASTNRADQENRRYKDIIFDDILDVLPQYFKIEHINNKFYLERSVKALFPSQMTTSIIFLITNTLSRLWWPAEIDQLSQYFYNVLNQPFASRRITLHYIRQSLISFYWRKRIYRAIISRLKPQIILLQTAYTNHAIVAAARESNIRVIEFQHGIIDRYHPGYSWTSDSAALKPHMPIPHRIFIYGDYWQQEIAVNGFWKEELTPVGSLRIDHFRAIRKKEIARKLTASQATKKIIVTTQALDVDRLILFLKEFIEISKYPLELYIKLHPRESNLQPYLNAFSGHLNVHIFSGQESPSTFELLSTADYHASIHSTCHYEALGLGVPTIILPFTNHERVLSLCTQAQGYAFVASTPQDMSQIIMQNRLVPTQISDFYFMNNAKENILSELKQDGYIS